MIVKNPKKMIRNQKRTVFILIRLYSLLKLKAINPYINPSEIEARKNLDSGPTDHPFI
jgi:hypothetical protein